jgi:hypothetical protein
LRVYAREYHLQEEYYREGARFGYYLLTQSEELSFRAVPSFSNVRK